jgi:cytochrome bd-type quinol oxidase subunit 2
MTKSSARPGTRLTLPLVLLTVGLLENVVAYKVRQRVHDVHWRTALMLVLYGAGFAAAATWVSPALRRLLLGLRQSSHRGGGLVGQWLFYGLAYGLVYWAYLVLDRHGPAGLLPPAWR